MIISYALILKSMIGFFLVFIIQIISKTKVYYISALIPLFPSIAIFSYYFVGKEKGLEKLQSTIIFGMFSLIPYFFFLLSLYFFVSKFKTVYAIIFSAAIWFVVAFVQILVWKMAMK